MKSPLWTAFFFLASSARAASYVMTAWSGSDGPFNAVSMDGNTIYQSADQGGGTYAGFMYFRRPAGLSFTAGASLYVEVDYKDSGGPGRIGMQYNSSYADFQNCGFVFKTSVQNSSAYKTAAFRIDYADLRLAQNGGNDLRLTRTGNLRLHVREMRVSAQPGPAYLSETAFIAPYSGPAYDNGNLVDRSSMAGKLLCGYQGWFRTPADDADSGWQHYIPNWGGQISPAGIAMDFWPDMTEFTPAERHAADGFSHPDGSQAELFSSLNFRTTLRHFQWMESWGIDGVALQRNHDDLLSPGSENLRHLTYVRDAANRTGRAWFVEYALKIPTTAADIAYLRKDWQYLVDVLKVTQDAMYLHHGGKPVAGVYGFFTSQIDTTTTANAVLDIFLNPGPYQSFVAGAGLWSWRTDFNPAWKDLIYRMGSYQPWNVGNGAGPSSFPNTDYWAADKAALDSRGVMYVPLAYAGGSADNRGGLPPGTTLNGRQQGAFLWHQISSAWSIGAQSVFLAMFDELDEGTQIIKATSAPPTQAYFLGYDNLPSDCYLCFTGRAAKMLRNEIPYSAVKPDCAAMTQPSIPEPVAPAENASLSGLAAGFSWTQAYPAQAAASAVDHYELDVDGVLSSTTSLSALRSLGAGSHAWRVRAYNTLGNASGWSLKRPFSLSHPSTPVPTSGAFDAAAAPNPFDGENLLISVGLGFKAERIKVRIYSAALSLARERVFWQPFAPGRHVLKLEGLNLSNGTYHGMVEIAGEKRAFKLAALR